MVRKTTAACLFGVLMLGGCSAADEDSPTEPFPSQHQTFARTPSSTAQTARPHPPQRACAVPGVPQDLVYQPSLVVEATLVPAEGTDVGNGVLEVPLADPVSLWSSGNNDVPRVVLQRKSEALNGRFVLLLRTDDGKNYYLADGIYGAFRVEGDDLLYRLCAAEPGGKVRQSANGIAREELIRLVSDF